MNKKGPYLAHFRFHGKLVEDGYLDLKKSAEVLVGIDELFRYFLSKQSKQLGKIDFEIPVRINKGSWEALIPENIGEWISLVLGTGLTTYSLTALKELAKNDFKDKDLKSVFKKVIKSIKWSVSIAKHLNTTKKKTFESILFKEVNGIQFIGIKNDQGEVLYVPKVYLEFFSELPATIFKKIAIPIEEERTLSIDFSEEEKNDKDDVESEVNIDIAMKSIFYGEEEEDAVLFPELEDGMYVELEGHVTRGNENSNTIGFQYSGHILICYPNQGNIKREKSKLFTNCIIKGFIDRIDKEGNYIEKKPKIRFLELILLDDLEDRQKKLFE